MLGSARVTSLSNLAFTPSLFLATMSEPSKTSGMWESAKGNVKGTLCIVRALADRTNTETFGSVTGNERLEAEGKAQKLTGKSEQHAADTQRSFSGKKDEIVGESRQQYGSVTGDRSEQIGGAAQKTKGEFKQTTSGM